MKKLRYAMQKSIIIIIIILLLRSEGRRKQVGIMWRRALPLRYPSYLFRLFFAFLVWVWLNCRKQPSLSTVNTTPLPAFAAERRRLTVAH